MLKPNTNSDRVGYGSILVPPAGTKLNMAVGTTYSLDLEALTAVCLSLGLGEDTDSMVLQSPIGMLDAIRRVSEKVLIFCEAGQIKMPSTPSALSLLLEKMVIPVALPKHDARGFYPSFHPKTWLLQYVDGQGRFSYRFAVLSRNLTFDRSWDVCFSMDSLDTASTSGKTKPIIAFLDYLRSRIGDSTQNAREKRGALEKLAKALSGVSFSTGTKEFGEDFEILPLGIGARGYDMKNDPLLCPDPSAADYSFHELVVFSPFLSGAMIDHWNEPAHSLTGTSRVLITRKSELSKITEAHSDRFRIFTLKDDVVDGETALSDESDDKLKQDIHAKIYLRRKYSTVDLYLGSMNATWSAVNRNVEMLVRLRTKNRYYNSERFLREIFCGDEGGQQNPFELSKPTEVGPDPSQEMTSQLEQVIKTICRMPMKAAVTARDGKYDISLEVEDRIPEGDISITPFRRDNPIPMKNSMLFPRLELLQVSVFFRLQVKADDTSVERIIMIPTSGIPAERENAVVNNVVKDRRSFVEYVAFVLGDNHLMSLLEEQAVSKGESWKTHHDQLPALYEKMLKTALDEPERLGEIEYLLKMVSDKAIIPDEFRDLYDTFMRTVQRG